MCWDNCPEILGLGLLDCDFSLLAFAGPDTITSLWIQP